MQRVPEEPKHLRRQGLPPLWALDWRRNGLGIPAGHRGREPIMSESHVALAPAFEAPTREAWLKLVDKVLKGGDFEKRLVGRTADGVALSPLATRADVVGATAIA